jgi:hypothetical protein
MRYNYAVPTTKAARAVAFRAVYLAIDELVRDQLAPLEWRRVVQYAQEYGRRNEVSASEVEALGRMTLAELVSGGLE